MCQTQNFSKVSIPRKEYQFISSKEVSALLRIPHQWVLQVVCGNLEKEKVEWPGIVGRFVQGDGPIRLTELLMTDEGLMWAIAFLGPYLGDAFCDRYDALCLQSLFGVAQPTPAALEALQASGVDAKTAFEASDKPAFVAAVFLLLKEFGAGDDINRPTSIADGEFYGVVRDNAGNRSPLVVTM